MDLLSKIIDFVLSLLGIKRTPGLAQGDELPQRVATHAREALAAAEDAAKADAGDEPRVIMQSDGASLVEDDGEEHWRDLNQYEVARNQWQDVWGPLAKLAPEQRLEEWLYHSRFFDELHMSQPREIEQKLKSFGYRSVGEYFRTRATLNKYQGSASGPLISDCMLDGQAMINAMIKADARIRKEKMGASLAQNPELLAPVEGVSVEVYAQIAARVAQQISQPDLLALLASHRIDMATWQRANEVWTDRMSKDSTFTISQVYSNAFMSSGQGQFAAAGAAAMVANAEGSGPQGHAPLPMEKVAEVQGAMSAWSRNGKDVNALLKKQFNMVAMDFSAASMWWQTKLTGDWQQLNAFMALCESYEKKYLEKSGGDADIQF